jgi:hypothetical protein
MSPAERKGMINRDRTDLSLTSQCKLLKISRSSLYYTPVGVNAETLEPVSEITTLTLREPCPCCGGQMHIIEIFRRGQKPMSRAPPREQAA